MELIIFSFCILTMAEALTPHLSRRQYIRGYLNALKQEQRNIDFNFDANARFAQNGETLGTTLDESQTLLGLPKATLLPTTALKYRGIVQDPTTALKSLTLEELAFAAAGSDKLISIIKDTYPVPMPTMLFPGFLKDELLAAKQAQNIPGFQRQIIPEPGDNPTGTNPPAGAEVDKSPESEFVENNQQSTNQHGGLTDSDTDDTDSTDSDIPSIGDFYSTDEDEITVGGDERYTKAFNYLIETGYTVNELHAMGPKEVIREASRARAPRFDPENPYVGNLFRKPARKARFDVKDPDVGDMFQTQEEWEESMKDERQKNVDKARGIKRNSHKWLGEISDKIASATKNNLQPLHEAHQMIRNPTIKKEMTNQHIGQARDEHRDKHKNIALQTVKDIQSPDPDHAEQVASYLDEVHYPYLTNNQKREVNEELINRPETVAKMLALKEKEGTLQESKLFGEGRGLPKSVYRQVGYGAGLKLRRNPVMHGRGLYYPVGDRHYINFKQLMNEGAINIKDHKFKSTGIRKSVMGGNVLSAVKSVLQGEKPDVGDIEPLNDTERQYLNQLGKVTGEGKFNVPLKEKTKQEKLTQEFEILKGQIIAGNDNEELVKKFKKICLQCVSAGALPKSKVQDVLIDLAALGY